MTHEENIEKLKEIIKFASKLNWIEPSEKGDSNYTMRISEVEKCMLAMVDDFEFNRYREWAKDME